MRKFLVLNAFVALAASPACSADCTNASVAAYQLAGFSCTVAGLTFSDFSVSLDKDGSGAAVLGNIYPVTLGDRRGLVLNYSAVADSGGTATLFFAYKVAGQSISDALAVITGVTADGGQILLNEQVGAGTMSMNGAGSTSALVPQTDSLQVRATVVHVSGHGHVNSGLFMNAFGSSK